MPLDEIPYVLETGDALLLPYSFESSQRAIVSTSYPTKTADYLASGVPILVHAPEYASITRTARDGGWAETVSDEDPEALLVAINRLAADNTRRRELTDLALAHAREHHDLQASREQFAKLLTDVASGRA